MWAASEFGADQCNPAQPGRYKVDGTGACYWDPNDFGPNQCEPDDYGRYKVDGTGACYWEPNDVGSNQCHPSDPDGRYRLDGNGSCDWTPSVIGADECVPNLPPPDEPSPDDPSGQQLLDVCTANITTIALAKRGEMVDGILHVKLEIDPALFGDMGSAGSIASAIKKAAENWNQHTASTKVHWIPVASAGHIEFYRRDQSENGGNAGTFGHWEGCGGASPYGGRFFLTKDTIDRNSLEEIEIAATHEIGHFYGISNSANGIMVGLSSNAAHADSTNFIHAEDCYDMLRDGPGHGRAATSIQPSDVQFATSCVSQALGSRQFNDYEVRQLKKDLPLGAGGGFCMQSWYTQVTYSCSSINGQFLGCAETGVYYLSLISSDCPY